ncbi:MAG: exosortase-associated EpsI family protein [Pirellula sp.]
MGSENTSKESAVDLKSESSSDTVGVGSTHEESKGQFRWLVGIAVSLALIGVGGLLQGSMSNRWGVPKKYTEIGAALKEVPMKLGQWQAVEEQTMDPTQLAILECEGYILRSYVHQSTGESINVAVLFGPKGPIAVHTPEICFSSVNMQPTSLRAPQKFDFDKEQNTFWRLGFVSSSIEKTKLSVAYAWSDGGPWVAAEQPRFWRSDYLYKIQTAARTLNSKQDSTEEFFRLFLPELRKYMTLKSSE